MKKVSAGNRVKVHYTGKLSDGTVFDSSEGREPLEFTLGEGHLIQGFENAVAGMSAGEKKTVTIPAEQAYGPRRDDLVVRIDRSQVPGDIELEVGMGLQIKQNGGAIQVVVTELDEKNVTLDANHPLSGQDLTFEIELVEIT
ncbi:MAG: peptidylprolyl isomerase [Alphaproteobacteria bacterium]|uniref:Peptidyl-prolyl cis-trans isomerase n=1 Tax=Candidatus Nitrobium versatile TaxID=2884831 RepID=A0A953M1W5_9BACT|nr:peptidylprolyl isomerase [Candidatus Nitrobium versatile]